MIKYKDTYVVFEEIPDEVTLAINITNCQNRCEGCHSPELRGNIGSELTKDVLDELISKNDGITCICFMGEGNDKDALYNLVMYIRQKYGEKYKIAIYSGTNDGPDFKYWLDYLKVGPYIPEFGPLNKRTTNQRLFKVERKGDEVFDLTDITYKFWK